MTRLVLCYAIAMPLRLAPNAEQKSAAKGTAEQCAFASYAQKKPPRLPEAAHF
jgi:hypothetical protein